MTIIPNDRNALIGVERASAFKEVVKFQKEAELFIKVGDFNNALQSVNKASQLDSINQKTKNLRMSLDKLILVLVKLNEVKRKKITKMRGLLSNDKN